MRNLLIVFFIICFILMIFAFPFKTRIMGHINLLEMKCYYSVKAWLLKLLCGKIIVENSKVKMTNENTLFSNSYNEEFMKLLTKEILSKINVKKVEIFFTGGFKENSFSSAIICGTILMIVQTFFGYLSLTEENVKIYEDINPTFNENNLELTVDIVVSISIFGLIKCIFRADKRNKKLKELKNEG